MRKILAVILCACMLTALSLPAYAEDSAAAAAGQLESLDLVKGSGGGVTPEYLSQTASRMQGAIVFLRLIGKESAALTSTGTANFTDVGSAVSENNKKILGYLKSHPEYGFSGTGNNQFSPLDNLTAQQFYKVLLTALGYKQGSDFTWESTAKFAESKGLSKAATQGTAILSMNDVCVSTKTALLTQVNGGATTLLAKLVDSGVISAEKAVNSGLLSPGGSTAQPQPFMPPPPPPVASAAVAPVVTFVSFNDYELTVSVSSTTPNASIYYTYSLDGAPAVPGTNSPCVSSGDTITIEQTGGHTVRMLAIASAVGLNNSPLTQFTYNGFIIESVLNSNVVTLADQQLTLMGTTGATTAGSLLNALQVSSGAIANVYDNAQCTGDPVSLSAPILDGYAVKVTMGSNNVYNTYYQIDLATALPPVATPPGGTYSVPQTVTLTSVSGGNIYYTIIR